MHYSWNIGFAGIVGLDYAMSAIYLNGLSLIIAVQIFHRVSPVPVFGVIIPFPVTNVMVRWRIITGSFGCRQLRVLPAFKTNDVPTVKQTGPILLQSSAFSSVMLTLVPTPDIT